MALTPLDIENTRFKGAFGGYNRAEVDLFLIRISKALEDQLEQAQLLKQRIAALEEEVARHRESEELLRNSVMLAQKTCDDLVAAARKKAEIIHDEALAEGDVIKREFAELRSQREQFEYAFHGLLTGFINRLEQGNPALVSQAEHRAIEAPAAGSERPDENPAEESATGGSARPALQYKVDEMPAQMPAKDRPAQPVTQGAERDGDIADFSSAITDAGITDSAWPGSVQNGEDQSPAADIEAESVVISDTTNDQMSGSRIKEDEIYIAGESDELFTGPAEDEAEEL